MAYSVRDYLRNILTFASTTDGSGNEVPHHKITDISPGTGATSLGKAEDAPHASGDTGVLTLGVRQDTRAVTSGTTGDYTPPIFDAQGNQYVVTAQKRATLSAVPTTAAGAYAVGDVVGTLMTISNAARAGALSGVIESIIVADKANVASNLDLMLFGANPSASTFTDNAAYTVNVADFDKFIPGANVDNVFAAAGNRVVSYIPPAGIPYVLTTTTLYAVLVARTGFTLASVSDIKLILGVRLD